MARSCGLRIGPRRFELVVLDGSAKKHKITAYKAGELPRDGTDPLAAAAAALREAVKQHNVPGDNVGVAIDTGLAAFRTIKVPFADKEKIEEVLKFEVEGQLPQWNIDDVVVDFHVLESTEDASELLVSAVQKSDISNVLKLCEKAGVEPLEVELETTAMVNAAMTASICTVDNAQVLVHIGETSTSVVVMDGGKVREMRAIHIGALSHEFPAVVEGEAPADGGESPAAAAAVPVDPIEVQRRLDQAIKRIRRELGRTVSAARTVHPIEAVYVCGLELSGLAGSRILDAEVKVLDVFEADGGQPAQGFGPLVVPYGVAVRQLGGGALRPSLRREELHYSGAFERVELPLAVVALLAITFLGVWFIFLTRERDIVNDDLATWRNNARSQVLGQPQKGVQGVLQYPSDEVRKYINDFEKDTERNAYEQLRRASTLVQLDVKKLEKDLGQDAEIKQPQSAFVGMTVVLDVLSRVRTQDDKVRPSLRGVTATYQAARTNKPEHVKVDLNMSLLADDTVTASQAFDDFTRDCRNQPWFVEFSSKQSDPVEGGRGIYYGNVTVEVDVSKVPAPKETP